mmetsp:Transcript_81529/g.212010  ORF Transcript_81529/g.212010 Transcript_81529/m.212010 type:complete len:568 (-) Transcript_81529:247-1950(-)
MLRIRQDMSLGVVCTMLAASLATSLMTNTTSIASTITATSTLTTMNSTRSDADLLNRSSFRRWCGIAINREQGNNYDSSDLVGAAGVVGAEKIWHYNWKLTSQVHLSNVQFVPTIRGPGETFEADGSELPDAFQDGRGGVIKGWNEPDDAGQAGRDVNLRTNPEAYAQAWTSDMLAAKAKGYSEFIGPAMAHDTCWLDYFLKACETTAGCKELVTYLAMHRYRLGCGSYNASSDNMGWRDDLSYVLTYYRLMQKYNARGFNIRGLVFDEIGCFSPSYTFAGEEEQLHYMKQWYRGTLVKVKTGDAEVINTIRDTNWIMPKGPDAHSGEPYAVGMCGAVDGGSNAAEDAVKAIQSLVTVAWFSISPGQNHLFSDGADQGLSALGHEYFGACSQVDGSSPVAAPLPAPAPTPAPTARPLPNDDELDGLKVRIINVVSERALYAAVGQNRELGIGAGPISEVHDDGIWRLELVDGNSYRIINEASNRALYATSASNWEQGLGAGSPPSEVGYDGEWKLVKHSGPHQYRIVAAHSNRCLYAQPDKNWGKGLGAGGPEGVVGWDGVWDLHVV